MLTQAAGKGLNVAQVLADLGHRLTVSGFLGEDNQPPFTAMFQRRGFADAFVRVPGETRSNIKLAERGGRVSDLNGPGPRPTSEPRRRCSNASTGLPGSTSWRWSPAACRAGSSRNGWANCCGACGASA